MGQTSLFQPADVRAEDFSCIEDKRLVQPRQLDAMANWIADADDLFLDYECDGLNARKGHRPHSAGFFAEDRGAKVADFRYLGDPGRNAVLDGLRRRNKRTRMFNSAFETQMSRAMGVELGEVWDAQAAAFAVQEVRPLWGRFKGFSQKALCHNELVGGDPMFAKAVEEWMLVNYGKGDEDDWDYSKLPASLSFNYNAEDVELGSRLATTLEHQVAKNGQEELVRTDSELGRVVGRLEERGIALDVKGAEALVREYSEGLKQAQQMMRDALKRDFEWTSGPAVYGLLHGEFKLPQHKDKAKHGQVDDDVLEYLIDHAIQDPTQKSVVQGIRDAREFAKLKDTYLMPWLYEWGEEVDGQLLLYPNLNVRGARTRRFSAARPNLQNVPARTDRGARVRAALQSRPGWTTYSMDESQAEYRAFAHYSRDPMLIKGYQQGGRTYDIHAHVSQMLGVLRKKGKHTNFGMLYGMGEGKLGREMGMQEAEAKAFLSRYHSMLPGIRRLKMALELEVKAKGYVRDAFGGRRHLGPNESYVAINSLCQMTVANLIRVVMVRCDPIIRAAGGHMLLQVHDEVVFELPGDGPEAWEAHRPTLLKLQHEMESFQQWFTVPFYTSCERWSPNWADAVEVAFAN